MLRHLGRGAPATCALVASVLLPVIAFAATPAPAVPDAQREQIESVIQDYLDRHPEVVQKALDTIQQREEAARDKRQRDAMAAHAKDLYEDPASPVAGNPRGSVTLVEFFDYSCPHCKHAEPAVKSALDKEGPEGALRVVYKEFPILGPGSLYASRAALASIPQGKYAAFHRALMEAQVIDEDAVQGIAKQVGLDVPRLLKDMESPAVQRAIEDNARLAGELEIQGTPAFIIGDQLLPGGLDAGTLAAYISTEKARGGAATAKTAAAAR